MRSEVECPSVKTAPTPRAHYEDDVRNTRLADHTTDYVLGLLRGDALRRSFIGARVGQHRLYYQERMMALISQSLHY